MVPAIGSIRTLSGGIGTARKGGRGRCISSRRGAQQGSFRVKAAARSNVAASVLQSRHWPAWVCNLRRPRSSLPSTDFGRRPRHLALSGGFGPFRPPDLAPSPRGDRSRSGGRKGRLVVSQEGQRQTSGGRDEGRPGDELIGDDKKVWGQEQRLNGRGEGAGLRAGSRRWRSRRG